MLGAGSAGLLAAISLKRKCPHLTVRVLRSSDIGVIGVGEGTTPNFPKHLFEYLGIRRSVFYKAAQPTWKLGIKFLWGPRQHFYYAFGTQLDLQWNDLPRANGYYCDEDLPPTNLPAALMERNKVFARQPNGAPDVQPWHAFHIENHKLVSFLEVVARDLGIEFIEGKVAGAVRGPAGVEAVVLDDNRRVDADFFVDASGFRSELLGRALEEPYVSYADALFCDRAVIGGWERTDEPILPYTVAETMDAGWAWQIEHEHFINRGYVYSSAAISDDDARAEFVRKNPRAAKDGRVVKFRSGRYRRLWVDNVCAIGNSAGFVEPLEATALMIACSQSQGLVDMLQHCGYAPTQTIRDLYNHLFATSWDNTRDFLAIHYKLNTRLDTPFWRHCRNDTNVNDLQPLLKFYDENGPTGFGRYHLRGTVENDFGIDGYLVMLVGNRVPYEGRHRPTETELQRWRQHHAQIAAEADTGMGVAEALAYVRHPGWQWSSEAPAAQG